MSDKPRITKITVEYDDNSKAIFDGDQMFLVIVDDKLEMYDIESTSSIGEEDIQDFCNSKLYQAKNKEFMNKVNLSKTQKPKVNHLRVVK